MTRERLTEIFDSIAGHWEGDNLVQGILILSKYIDPLKGDIIGCAEHDIVYGPDVDKVLEAGLTEEDATALAMLNWHFDEGCLACFV